MHGLIQSATCVHYQSMHSTDHAQVTCQPNGGNGFFTLQTLLCLSLANLRCFDLFH